MRGKFVILLEGYKLRVPGNKVPRRYLDINRYAIYRGKVKVKLSLCLTKRHAMKTYCGSGDVTPHIFDLGAKWR